MNLSKAKNDIKKMKKEIHNKTEPTLENFFRFCEKEYGYSAHYGEIWFDSYKTDGKEVKSNPVKFLRLSERYFKEIHQVPNPVKDGEYSLKKTAVIYWNFLHNDGKSNQELREYTMNEDKEFNNWFDDAWNDIIQKGDFTKYNQLYIDFENEQKWDYTPPK